jgi:hypothetical protein
MTMLVVLVVVMVVMVGQTHVIMPWASMSLSVGYPVPRKRTKKAELTGIGARLHSRALFVRCWAVVLVVVD